MVLRWFSRRESSLLLGIRCELFTDCSRSPRADPPTCLPASLPTSVDIGLTHPWTCGNVRHSWLSFHPATHKPRPPRAPDAGRRSYYLPHDPLLENSRSGPGGSLVGERHRGRAAAGGPGRTDRAGGPATAAPDVSGPRRPAARPAYRVYGETLPGAAVTVTLGDTSAQARAGGTDAGAPRFPPWPPAGRTR